MKLMELVAPKLQSFIFNFPADEISRKVRDIVIPEILKYVDENKEIIAKIPKMALLSFGKSGYNDTDRQIYSSRKLAFKSNSSYSRTYIDTETAKIVIRETGYSVDDSYHSIFDGEYSEHNLNELVCSFIGLREDENLFKHLFEHYSKEMQKPNDGMCIRSVDQFIRDAILYKYRVTWKEFILFYKGRRKICSISEKDYNDMYERAVTDITKTLLLGNEVDDDYRIKFIISKYGDRE